MKSKGTVILALIVAIIMWACISEYCCAQDTTGHFAAGWKYNFCVKGELTLYIFFYQSNVGEWGIPAGKKVAVFCDSTGLPFTEDFRMRFNRKEQKWEKR